MGPQGMAGGQGVQTVSSHGLFSTDSSHSRGRGAASAPLEGDAGSGCAHDRCAWFAGVGDAWDGVCEK